MKKLFLLDGMALVYRAHFALISRPIFNSKGVNTSALYGFTQTLLDILKNQQPTHIAVAFDTEAPTQRHAQFAEYKATRQVMPEDLSLALPHVSRMLEAFRIPALTCDGFEADDIIGTLVRRAEKEGFKSYMVTPDKDFGQLIDENTFLYKPGRMGSDVEILGLPEIQKRWSIQRPDQVIDVLALMGDSSDNIPGVPGIGEKTAIKLICQFGTVENLLSHTGELTGRIKESIEKNQDQARLSKRLVTILCDAPCPVELESLKVQPCDEEKLKALFVEFEFNSIGRRLFGEDFKAGRGFQPGPIAPAKKTKPSGGGSKAETPATLFDAPRSKPAATSAQQDLILIGETDSRVVVEEAPPAATHLKTITDVPHDYHLVRTPAERAELIRQLQTRDSFCLDTETTSLDTKAARLVGLAFSFAPHTGYYVPLLEDVPGQSQPPPSVSRTSPILEEFRPVLESDRIEKVGHNLKFDLSVLRWHGVTVRGKLFDTMLAHSLIEPEMRHGMDYLSEVYLGYAPIPITRLIPGSTPGHINLADVPLDHAAEYSAEDADVSFQLRAALEPLLKEKGQERVFYEIESPLISVLVDMEFEGIKVDAAALADFAAQLSKEIDLHEKTICKIAGTTFNLNSPRQLGQILFDVLKICAAPKKTRTGQYATDEQTLAALAPDHEIVQRLLEHRAASKLKSTYADALPAAIWPRTGRVHTTYNQVMTTTGRLNSQDPNLQNIPIRTERGQEIRKAFVPRDEQFLLLSADYSQIELRIIAALSREPGLLEAFKTGADVHTATAARVYGVFPELVTPEMRRKAKMVNYGIAYGISAFGLAQRLAIPRAEAAEIINLYFKQFPGIRRYMDQTIAFARDNGYVETVTGRRRYLRDVRSANNTVRSAAERNAINAPIQGTAADMIKLAMINIHCELVRQSLKTRMLLQVHDELVFDLFKPEEKEVRALVEEKMKTAIVLDVPLVVEIGAGRNWLEAH
ncbi:MAG TPA: DNA polymerase I [Candidatus Binatia bacterium]|nr:DNA polymerase I [Candidatus Binatia bacterium]